MSERERCKEKERLQYTGVQYDCNSKIEQGERPPVPGEERSHCRSEWVPQVPLRPPPRIPNHPQHLYTHNDGHPSVIDPRLSAPCRPLPPEPPSSSPPACLRWARALPHLLQDPDGVQLFRQYLLLEGPSHADHLDFWFACEGLRKHAQPDKVHQLIKVIYKRFFVKSILPVSEELRRDVGKQVKELRQDYPNINLFDAAQKEIERLISNTTYPNFLNSELYLQYVHSTQHAISSGSDVTSSGSSSSSSSISARDTGIINQTSGPLPTLHEDSELVTSHQPEKVGSQLLPHSINEIPQRLTKDLLLYTQNRRLDVRPKPEAYVGMTGRMPYHSVAYNSYAPVSRQDSELQSLSSHSDARTESDNMSLTDNSSIDGMSVYRSSRKHQVRASRAARELASVNRESCLGQTLIPRTQRLDSKQCQPLPPDRFAAILIEKLEAVKRQQEMQEALDKKLMENECVEQSKHMNENQNRVIADVIRKNFHHLDDDNEQDILDQHVSRVWSDLTPSGPDVLSPRGHSPSRRRDVRRRKERDVFSTFSSDSGNVHDFPDPETCSSGLPKSRSVPDYHDRDYMQDGRFVRQSISRRSSSKKTLTDLTDSGVSVVSDSPPVVLPTPAGGVKEARVLTWLMESDRRQAPGGSSSHTHSELSAGRYRGTRQPTSPNASRYRKPSGQSRSSSLERSTTCSGGAQRGREPQQPFVADPNMPPLTPPNTDTQLEEAKRRLDEEMRLKQSRQRGCGKSAHPMDSLSNQSTMRRSMRGSRPSTCVQTSQAPVLPIQSQPMDEFTTVVFSFCDEQFPYRTRIPGKHITLKQFKDFLPKKGNYRYFFKTQCEELDNQVIQEEIINDLEVLPLFEGKVMAQVKPTE